MAILKIISHGKTNAGKRRVLQYVMDPKKTEPHLCAVSGDFDAEQITPSAVFQNFMRVRKLFNKENGSGRTYTHGTVSFAPGEINHEDASEFAKEFVERVYPNNQVLTAVHTDTEHVHAHFVVEPVSFCTGKMLHTSKQDLEEAKKICNEMCQDRGLSIAQKGRHADGAKFLNGDISTWKKNKWHQMSENPQQSYLVELALAVEDCMAASESREEFCDSLEHEYGWSVVWKDSKKNIVFVNGDGKKVRDSNLSKTFNMNISKEVLEHEFARNSGRTRSAPGFTTEASAAEQANRTAGNREPMVERTASKNNGARR